MNAVFSTNSAFATPYAYDDHRYSNFAPWNFFDTVFPVPMEIDSDVPVPMEIDFDDPVPMEIDSDDPVPMEIDSDNPVPMEIDSDNPVPMEIDSDNPVPMEIDSDNPVPMEIDSDDPVQKDCQAIVIVLNHVLLVKSFFVFIDIIFIFDSNTNFQLRRFKAIEFSLQVRAAQLTYLIVNLTFCTQDTSFFFSIASTSSVSERSSLS